MFEIAKYEEKNREEALNKCASNLNTEPEKLFYKEREIEAKLFKSKKIEISAIKKEEIINYIKNFLNNISKLMNIDIKSEIKEKDNIINIILVTSNNAVMIGKEGRTLNALQTILKQSLNSKTNFNIRVNLDVANYKNKKIKNIEYEIRKVAKEVMKSKIDAKLDPMNSYERRLVHTIISEYEELTTVSEGIAPNRYIKIIYKEESK